MIFSFANLKFLNFFIATLNFLIFSFANLKFLNFFCATLNFLIFVCEFKI